MHEGIVSKSTNFNCHFSNKQILKYEQRNSVVSINIFVLHLVVVKKRKKGNNTNKQTNKQKHYSITSTRTRVFSIKTKEDRKDESTSIITHTYC